MKGLKSRASVMTVGALLVVAFFAFAFWPRPTLVDIGAATRGAMIVTIDEEARTRVRDSYVISAPINGRLLRVGIDPGAEVTKDETVVAEMTPVYPAALDIRTKEQAAAAVEAARAGLSLARAEARKARADADFASDEVERARELYKGEALAKRGLDRAEIAYTSARAALQAANSAISMRAAELERAEAMLTPPATGASADPARAAAETIAIRSPVSGHILRVFQESEAIVNAGAPILEVGDPHTDLEIVAELLSSDAVKVSRGDRVIIDKWGGDKTLAGVVDRVEPLGFTKVSALGVEEQRVNAIIAFEGGRNDDERLGDGFRVEVRIVIWENAAALRAPASALFRTDGDWAVFKIDRDRARRTIVKIGRNNGVDAEVVSGLDEGDRIVLFPGGGVEDGALVAPNKR